MSEFAGTSAATPDLGVLFVHGIGRQRQSDTLVRWGDALAGWLDAWFASAAPERQVRFRSARLHPSDPEPAHGVLEIQSEGTSVSWVVAEAFWGGDFSTPSFTALASWGVQALPIAVFGHVMGGIRRAQQHRSAAVGVARSYHGASVVLWAALGVPAALVVTPLLAALIIVLLVVGLLPIPVLRSAVAQVQRTLTGSVGDSLILLSSPTQAAAMTSRVELGVRYLRQELACPRVVVVAHSQGAAVTLRALSGSDDDPVDGLVTLGSGINKLEELRTFRQRSRSAWLPPALLLVALALGLWIWATVDAGEATWRGVWTFLAFYGAVGVLLAGAVQVVMRLIRSDQAQTAVLVTLMLSGCAALVVLGELVVGGVIVFVPVIFFTLALLGMVGGLVKLAGDLGGSVQADLIGRTRAWLDLHAYADPVPNGPTTTGLADWPWSVEVHNLDSTVRDHSYYSRAVDDGLARLAAFLLSRSPAAPNLGFVGEMRIGEAARRRQWRLLWLRWTRWLVFLAAVLFLWRHWSRLEQSTASTYDTVMGLPGLPSWLPNGVHGSGAAVLGVVAVLVFAAAVYLLLAAIWKLWDAAAGVQLLGNKEEAPFPGQLRALLVAWAAVIGLVMTVDRVPAGTEIASSWRDWVDSAVFFLVLVVVWAGFVPPLVNKAGLFEKLTQEPAALMSPNEASP